MTAITKTTDSRRAVCGPTYACRPFMGHDICTHEAEVSDFKRTTWRLWGVPIWRRDFDRVEVPMHQFIADCLGTGR